MARDIRERIAQTSDFKSKDDEGSYARPCN